MNLPGPQTATTGSNPVISTYSILLLSGMLFGICVSGSVSSDIKPSVVLAGALGLAAYLLLSIAARKQRQTQLRLATMQVEERLDRHSHFDLRGDSVRLDPPSASKNPA
jgi:hypothetical protein